MKTRPIRWWHKLFHRWSTPYRHDVTQALKAALHTGIGIGMRHQHRALSSIFCDQCGEPAAYPDARFCAMCGVALQHTERIPHVILGEATTDPRLSATTTPYQTVVVVPGTLLHTLNTAPGGLHTKVMQAVNQAQLAARRQQQKARQQ